MAPVFRNREYIYLKGKVKWFRQNTPDNKFEPARYNHVLYPNEESLEKIRELQGKGLKNKLRLDDDGYSVTIARPCVKHYIDKQSGARKQMVFEPPQLIDKDNKPCQQVSVGNGSTVTDKIEVYHYTFAGKPGLAWRWESSRLDELVEYNPPKDDFPHEAKAKEGLSDQPSAEEEMF